MSDKDLNINDINDDVNDGKETKTEDIAFAGDISFKSEAAEEKRDISELFAQQEKAEDNDTSDDEKTDESEPSPEADTASEKTEPDDIDFAPQNRRSVSQSAAAEEERKPVQHKAAPKKEVNKKKKRKKKKGFNNSIFGGLILVTIILTVSLVAAIGGISLGMEYLGIGKNDQDVTFNIPENATTDEIADILINNRIIENKFLFKVAMKLKSPAAIYPGTITLHPSMGYASIIDELAVQRAFYETVTITFPEGITLLEAANMLQENNVCTAEDFLFEFNKSQGYDFESHIDKNADSFYSMEGYFFPDTYNFYVDDSAYSVTATLRQHFDDQITDNMYTTMKEKRLSLSEVITIASIVQWEAGSVEDMPKVASVFINRLNDPDTFPSLQSDATKNYITKVIEAVGTDSASIEHYTDCYDTYACEGLPAGPVCNPGLDAINAVLNPADTNYYYFCNNLETGQSYFAETLEEHEQNLIRAGLA